MTTNFSSDSPAGDRRSNSLGLLHGLMNSVMASIALGALVLVGLLWVVVRSQDTLEAEASRQQYDGLMEMQTAQLASQVRDYSNWGEAISALVIKRDAGWWSENAGDYAVKVFGLSFSAFIDGKDAVPLVTRDEPLQQRAGDMPLLTPSVYALINAARSKPLSERPEVAVATGLVEYGGEVHLASAVRFTDTETKTVNPDPGAILVFARSLGRSVLPATARIMGTTDLRIQDADPHAVLEVPLALADQTLLGTVGWTPPTPGYSILLSLTPLVGGMSMLGLGVVWYARRRAVRLANAIAREASAHVELESRTASILGAAAEGIFGVDREGRVNFVNAAALAATGYTEDEFLHGEPHQLVKCTLPGHQASRRGSCPVRRALTEGTAFSATTETLRRKDGSEFPVDYVVTPVMKDGEVDGAVMVFRDITNKLSNEAEIRRREQQDALTQLPNRARLLDVMGQALRHAERERRTVAVLYLDLDHFKGVNEALGYAAGDLLLKQAGDRLLACVGQKGSVARLGGDEFVVLLAHRGADRNAAIEMADRILEELGSSFCVDGNDIWMGASIGISMYPEDGRDVTELQRNADVAMYEAKASGRNTHRRYNAAMLERTVAARAMEHDLRRAVANGEMFMQFQPIIDLRRGCLSHVEALLRWQCPKRGLVSPADFIPVAEASGLIDDIGDWVFEECCRQVRTWMDAGVEVGVAINVSARQVPRGLPIRRIWELLDKYQVPTRLVLIEITESVLLSRSSLVSGWINAAQALGIRLMIDDFGTGYSSLSYLKHFRLEALKVDKSFVGDVVSNHDDQTLVRAILAMSRSLGVAVIAEGVETEAQLHWLRENGCDYAQGYLLGRPQSAHATLEYALSNNVCMFFEDTRPSMLTEL